MPKHDASRKDDAKRLTLRLPSGTVRRIEEFSARNGISNTRAVDMLVGLGLDAELAGVEGLMTLEQKIVSEMRSMRGLIVAGIDSADAATAAVLAHQVAAGLLESDGMSSQFVSIRRAVPKLKALKRQASAAGDDMMAGTIDEG